MQDLLNTAIVRLDSPATAFLAACAVSYLIQSKKPGASLTRAFAAGLRAGLVVAERINSEAWQPTP